MVRFRYDADKEQKQKKIKKMTKKEKRNALIRQQCVYDPDAIFYSTMDIIMAMAMMV